MFRGQPGISLYTDVHSDDYPTPLQFVHQVVSQVLCDVFMPALPHARGGGRVGRRH